MAAMLPKLFFVHFRDTSFVAEDDGDLAGFLCGFRSQTSTTRRTCISSASTRTGEGRASAAALRAVLRGRPAADRGESGHVARERAFGGFPPGTRLRDRAHRPAYDGCGEARSPARQAPRLTPKSGMRGWAGDADPHKSGVAVPVYRGKFGPPQAERLLWRAGFGPRPGEAEALAKKGLDGAVDSLLNPGAERSLGRSRTTTRAARSPRVTRGATTTAGGSIGWCAHPGRSSSG